MEAGARWGKGGNLAPVTAHGFSLEHYPAPLAESHALNLQESDQVYQLVTDAAKILGRSAAPPESLGPDVRRVTEFANQNADVPFEVTVSRLPRTRRRTSPRILVISGAVTLLLMAVTAMFVSSLNATSFERGQRLTLKGSDALQDDRLWLRSLALRMTGTGQSDSRFPHRPVHGRCQSFHRYVSR